MVLTGDCGAQVQSLPGEPAPRHAVRDLPMGMAVATQRWGLSYTESREAGEWASSAIDWRLAVGPGATGAMAPRGCGA